jgi:hypothetical protein
MSYFVIYPKTVSSSSSLTNILLVVLVRETETLVSENGKKRGKAESEISENEEKQ